MTTINSGTLNYVSAGPVRRETKKEKNSPRRGGHMTGGTHHRNGASYPPTDSSTYSRTWYNRVTPTKRSTQPPCTPAVQQMTYTAVVYRGRERAAKQPWIRKTKARNISNTQSHEHILPSTYSPTNRPHPPIHRPINPPTHQPTDPRCATAIQQSRAAAAAADASMMMQTELQ